MNQMNQMHLHSNRSSTLTYRPEIDGLRAIAVLSVILYHAKMIIFGQDWFEGGFIGVDIFFVISGYLITRIILLELYTTGRFNFLKFYERRARRILPMLFLVIFVSAPFAWQKLLPLDFIEYAESVISSLFFGSNFFFYFSTTEYGADSALLKPFLHTWSLGVEEQFYLVFPIIAITAFKYLRKQFLPIIIILSLLSLYFAEMMEARNPDLNFYLPFSRFWELAAGSILAFRELNGFKKTIAPWKKALPAAGLLLISYSIFYFDSKTPHPGYHTTLPILGVALIIGFSSKEDIVGKLLGSKPFVSIGLISYSAYLWHFPIFAFSRLGANDNTNLEKTSWIIITVVLSIFSYFIIEKTFRRKFSLKAFSLIILTSLLATLGFGAYIIESKGIPTVERFGFNTKIVESIQRPMLFDGECYGFELDLNGTTWCQLGAKEKQDIDFIIIGDSHSMSSTNLLDEIASSSGLKGLYAGTSGCPALLGIYPYRGQPHPNESSSRCYNYNKEAYSLAKKLNIENVILISRWDYYVDGSDSKDFNLITDKSLKVLDIDQAREIYKKAVENTVKAYSEIDSRLVVLLQIPHQTVEPKRIFEDLLTSYGSNNRSNLFERYKSKFLSVSDHHKRQEIANETWFYQASTVNERDLILIDPTDVFCNQDVCPIYDSSTSFYFDDDHASTAGFARLREKFTKVLVQ